MISVAPIGRGLVSYLCRTATENYYFQGGERPGQWLGSACASLQVSGKVERKTLRALTLGFGVHGKKLVQNAGKLEGDRKRHLGMSYVFNACKSFSVAWAFAEPEMQCQMQAAFDRAVARTVREYIEPEIARCRLGDGTQVPAKIVGAHFVHIVSREGDMHVHGHLLIPSLGVCPDGRTRALISKLFYDHKLDAGAYFRLALEQECSKLGFQFYRPLDAKGEEKEHTEVQGVPENICRHFSKRRRQIEDNLDAKGLASAAASAVATLQTRRGKEIVPPRPELFDAWRQEAVQNGLSLGWQGKVLGQSQPVDQSQEYFRAVRQGIEECTQQEGHFQRKDIFREAFVSAQARGGVDPLRFYTCLNDDLQKSPDFVNLGVRNKIQRFSVPEVLRVEDEMLRHAEKLQATKFTPLPDKIVDRAAKQERRLHPSRATTPAGMLYDVVSGDKRTYTLDPEQQACVRYATQSPGRLKAIYGGAGTAKTTVAASIADAYQQAGYRTYGASLSGVAAKNFAEKTGVQSDTIRMTLMRLYPTTAQLAKHHLHQLWRAARGMKTHTFDGLKLDRKSVLFAEEASMIGTRDFALLTKACAEARATMILIGDAKQLPAIEQGGAFGSIIHRTGGFELTTNKRQEREQERKRVEQLARGEAETVIKTYAREGALHVARTHADAQRKLIADWVKHGGLDAPKDHAILAATNLEIRDLNNRAQRERLDARKLSQFCPVRVGDETFYRGDRVLFTKKSRKLGVENGDAGTIVGIRNNPLSAALKVRLDGETESREIPLRTLLQTHYDGLTRGYAMTVHKMQGRTVDHTYCHLSGGMTDHELTYVSHSRHRKTVRIYTDENHAGVALTNLAREATGDGRKITAKPGLNEQYSPLIAQATKSHAKTLAADQKQTSDLTLKLERGG